MDAASPINPVLGDLPKVIPPCELPNRRTMVLCFDGTGDQFDADVGTIPRFEREINKLTAAVVELERDPILLTAEER